MSPIQIALLLLAVAGVWAIAELALTLRKTRNVVDSLDKTVNDLNNTIAEAQPVVAKLTGCRCLRRRPDGASKSARRQLAHLKLVEVEAVFATFLRLRAAWPRPAMLCRA
ncbi:MAG: hypothetical protein ACLRM9_09135 [Collinsella aerofaciens]